MKKLYKYQHFIVRNFTTIFRYLLNRNKYIFIDGYPHTENFGDALSTPIVEFLSGKKVLPSKNISRFLFSILKFQNYAVIGSILQWIKKDAYVWGAGFISPQKVSFPPAEIFSVRGPKTRQIYLEAGIGCPEVYGDPALILPLMYFPEVEKRYKFGIIPHYVDVDNPWILKMKARKDVLIIDLMVYTDYKKVVDQILQCENILSSSLHGLIVSDAYKIPNIQIKLSHKVLGNDFKFEDYYESVGRKKTQLIKPELDDTPCMYKIDEEIIQINLKELLEVCPFIAQAQRKNLIQKFNDNKNLAHLNG